MAKITVSVLDTIEAFRTAFNTISNKVGDTALLTGTDSDIIKVVRRIDSTQKLPINAVKLNGQPDSYYLRWANTLNKPFTAQIPESATSNPINKYYTKVRVDSDITFKVKKPFIDALLVSASTLANRDSLYFRSFANQTNTTGAITNAMLIDKSISLTKLDSVPGGAKYIMAFDGKDWIAATAATLQGVAYLNFENSADVNPTDSDIKVSYNNKTPLVDSVRAKAGTSDSDMRWTPKQVRNAALAAGSPVIPTAPTPGSPTIYSGTAFTSLLNKKHLVNTTSGPASTPLPVGVVGSVIGFIDYAGKFDSNPCTLYSGTQIIMGQTVGQDLILDKRHISITLEYVDGVKGWLII